MPQEDMGARADPDDAYSDGISGRLRHTLSLERNESALGRYGWKATAPTQADQIANAFAVDKAQSTRMIRADGGDCQPRQTDCLRVAAFAGDPSDETTFKVRDPFFDLVVAFNRGLAAPAFRGNPDLRRDGSALFASAQRAACRIPPDDAQIPPFSNPLLHDMGPGLADTRPKAASPQTNGELRHCWVWGWSMP